MMSRPVAAQRGFILVVALMMLVAMTLLGVALVRSVDTATQVANNLGFKQSSLAAGDYGTEQAITWIQANTSSLIGDVASSGYYSTEQAGTDYTGQETADTSDDVDWTGLNGARRAYPITTPDAAGNRVAYLIQRQCDQSGGYVPGGTIQCATSTSTVTTGASKGAVGYGRYAITGKAMIYYRITTRTVGPRNSTSYVQTMVQVEY